jgi:hypothetical protein
MTTTGPFDEGAAPSPQESLAVIDATLRDARQAFGFADAPLYLVWGLAWVILFAGIQLVAAPAYAPLSHLPLWTAGAVGAAAIGAAAVFSGVHGARQTRGIGGASQRLGRRIGVTWVATFASAGLMVGLLDLAGPLSGALFVFAVAVLYMGQGAVFADDVQFGAGLWLAAVNAAALLSGPELFNLLIAVLGGGGLLAAGALTRRRQVEAPHGI